MRARAVLSVVAAAGVWLLSTANASAVTLNVLANGLTATNANYACDTGYSNCLIQRVLQLDAPATVSGTITIDASLTLATINFQLASATFAPLVIDEVAVLLENVTFTGSVPIGVFGGTVSQLGPGTGTASGTANGVAFSVAPTVYNLTCSSLTAAGQCGVQFGANGFGSIGGHHYVTTFNVLVAPVPEPGAATLLLLVGLAGLVRRARA